MISFRYCDRIINGILPSSSGLPFLGKCNSQAVGSHVESLSLSGSANVGGGPELNRMAIVHRGHGGHLHGSAGASDLLSLPRDLGGEPTHGSCLKSEAFGRLEVVKNSSKVGLGEVDLMKCMCLGQAKESSLGCLRLP